MKTLRWIAVLPVSVVAVIAVYYSQRIAVALAGISPDSFLSTLLMGLLCGVAFVYCGVYVSPSHRDRTALVLMLLGVGLCIFSMTVGFKYSDVTAIIGLVGTYLQIKTKGFDSMNG